MKRKKVRSIQARLLIPLSIVLLFQMAFLLLFYQYGGVISTLRNNAVEMFSETTRHSQLNMERELMMYWMNSIQDTGDIPDTIEGILNENGYSPEDIRQNPELNRIIISTLTERLIDILHYSFGNGIYLVLDGPASINGDAEEQAGIFIRDMDASTYEADHSDLLMERGLPSVAREYDIALDSFWELGFNLENMETGDFYRKPVESASEQKVEQENAVGCAYLGVMKPKTQEKAGNLSYSIPIILSDGSVIGAVGGEISAGRIRQFLEDDVSKGNTDSLTVLAKNGAEENSFIPVISGGILYEQYFRENSEIRYEESDWDSVGIVKDEKGNVWYAAVEPLKIYSDNTPFADETWMVVQLGQEKNLFADINAIQRILLISVAVSLLVGLVLLVLASNVIIDPIRSLIKEMGQLDLNSQSSLKKIQIREIDELVDAINRLNTDVAEHASKISQILDVLDLEIGVFEYESTSDKVFCSHSLLKLLGIPCEGKLHQFIDKDEFLKVISRLKNLVDDADEKIYEFEVKGEIRYIQMKFAKTKGQENIGVLVDVTREMNERKKLEQERDCDPLTGLYNRGGFRKRAKTLLEDEGLELAAFVMWDMDNLKYVNDTYGHEMGDRYIRMFAEHLRRLEQAGAVVERRSGDEFMAILYHGSEEELSCRIQNFMEQLKEIILEVPDECQIPLRASAGVSWYPKHGTQFDDLVRYADFAMYMSKHSYKGIVQEFDAETYQTNAYLLSGREELNQILENRNVKFALQPIVTRTGKIYGYEVLMRPSLKKLRNISELLHLTKIQAKQPQFEELTWFEALKWVSERESRLAEGAKLFINSISNVSLSSELLQRLEENYGGLLNRIVLESTETEEADQNCLEFKIAAIRKWGGLLALDDYGAGYSNEAALLKIEPNLVKMDLTLVRGIHTNENQQTIAKNLINYCHPRNIMVVAEGVETEEELEFLMKIKVDLFQGYYLARPNVEIQPLDPAVVKKMQEMTSYITI